MSDRLITDCVLELQQKIPLIIADYATQFPGQTLGAICTLRSIAEQQADYAKGRTVAPIGARYEVTTIDGVTKFSKHNPWPNQPLSQAVDFGVFINKAYMTEDSYYYPLLDLARKYSLISGLDFFNTGLPLADCLAKKTFHDPPHVEVPGPLYMPKQVS